MGQYFSVERGLFTCLAFSPINVEVSLHPADLATGQHRAEDHPSGGGCEIEPAEVQPDAEGLAAAPASAKADSPMGSAAQIMEEDQELGEGWG